MGCLFGLFGAFFPRLATLFIWIARPTLFSAAFGGSWFWPILGILFLPFTTLMYVLLWSPGIGLASNDWLWLILAFALDVASIVSSVYTNRNRMPSYATV